MQSTKKQKVLRLLKKHLNQHQLTIHDHGDTYQFGNPDTNKHATITVKDPVFYQLIANKGTIGFGEAYTAGAFHTPNLENTLTIFCANSKLTRKIAHSIQLKEKTKLWLYSKKSRNTLKQSTRNIQAHYDLGYELYSRLLCSHMMYSSAIYTSPEQTLEEASLKKLQRICKDLSLQPTDNVLEIGTGWGGLAIHMAKNHGCHVTTTTISNDQYDHTKNLIKKNGLEHQITLLKSDYRLLKGKFDKIVSIEMIEAVGKEHLKQYTQQCNNLLKSGGLCFIQAICMRDQDYDAYRKQPDFIQQYIFPGGFLPSLHHLLTITTNHTDLQIKSASNIASDYVLTLRAWQKKLINTKNELEKHGYDDQFIRLWNYYLCYCMAGFQTNRIANYQILLKKSIQT